MRVKVPTSDFLRMLTKLKPMRAVSTTGFTFAVYTFDAYEDKFRVVVSDNAGVTATTEIFAKVVTPGRVSVNGTDFFQLLAKITPATSQGSGSEVIELYVDGTKLILLTDSKYGANKKNVHQRRNFSLVKTDLYFNPDFPVSPNGLDVVLPGSYLSDIFRILSRLISNYTSDIAGLSGILLRCEDQRIHFVVSDGFRIVEINYPGRLQVNNFDLIIPKMSCNMLQSLIDDGDEVSLRADNYKALFTIENNGLTTTLTTPLIKANFPPYHMIFDTPGLSYILDTKILLDNVSNVRRAIDDDTYRLRLSFENTGLSVSNYQAGHADFVNQGIPLTQFEAPATLLINGFLLENSLSLLGAEMIKLVVPPEDRPIIIDNLDSKLHVRIAVALSNE